MDLYEIIRRWHDQQAIAHIAIALNNDRKTVRKYIATATALGLSPDLPLPAKEIVFSMLQKAIPQNNRPKTAQEKLEPFLSEIAELVNDKYNCLKPKIAFEVICQKHDLTGKVSYSSFKNFVHHHQPPFILKKPSAASKLSQAFKYKSTMAKLACCSMP